MKLASFEAIVRALNDGDTRYLVVGGLAVAAHGYGRVTFDIDIVLELQTENIKNALEALAGLGYKPALPVNGLDFADPATRKSWLEEKNMVVFQLHSDTHRETRIDIFVTEPFDFDEEYTRALTEEFLPGLPVRFVCIETLIHMKELAGREKDREDIRQLTILMENRDNE